MELHKKVIGNAISCYFMVLVSLGFLWSKDPYISHPFVKSHVKTAFSLHILLLLMLFIMGYGLGDGISFFGFASLNDIITSLLGLFIFAGILYGAYQAHLGKTVTLGEVFHKTGSNAEFFQSTQIEKISEEQNTFLILAHVPFFGFIISGQHSELPHMRDISLFHLLALLLAVIFYSTGYTSLANIMMLAYIVWSIVQSMRLIFQNEITTLDMSFVPTPQEKYILMKSLFSYLISTMHAKKDFITFKDIVAQKTLFQQEQERRDTEKLQIFSEASLPHFLFYIPIINIIGLFFMKTRERIHIENGLVLTFLFITVLGISGFDNPYILFFLFPVFFGIGKLREKSYRMPYLYDIFSFFSSICYKLTHIFHKTRELQKTNVQETRIISETKKEA